MPLRLRRGTDSTRTSITPVQGEPIYTTDTKKMYIGDGTTAGGVEIGGTTVTNSGDNRVITSDGTSTGLVAESNLSFNGTQLTITGSIISPSFTGSLQGSSSYSIQSLSSSFATNSSTASYVLNAVSASFATTASYVLNAVSSSFATNSSTASYVLNSVSSSFATTASYVLNSVSSSFATTASYVLNSVSSSFATSASFASTSTTASFVNTLTQNVTISGSVFVSGSIENVNYITFDANSSSPASLSTGIYSVGNNITVTGSSINLYTNSGTVRISGTNLINNAALVVNSGSITATNGIIATGSILVDGIVNATSFTGSLQGTATSASYWGGIPISASFATTASFASTSSFVNTLTQNVTVSGSIFLSGSLNTPVFVDYEERFSTPGISIAPSPGVLILNLANGNVFDVALNANITTLTISSPPAANNAGSFVLIFTADGTPRVVSWGASILWPGGIAPTLTATNGKKDVFGFVSLNSGTNFLGFIGGQNI